MENTEQTIETRRIERLTAEIEKLQKEVAFLRSKIQHVYPLKGVNPTTVVHCVTEEEAKAVLMIAAEHGYCWVSGESYVNETKWHVRKEKAAYFLNSGLLHNVDYFIGNSFTILTAEEFINLNS